MYRQSSSGSRVWRRKVTTIASSASVRTVERGAFGPALRSLTVSRFRHLATVFGLTPSLRLSTAIEACASQRLQGNRLPANGSLYCCFDSVRGRGAAMTNLSQRVSFHSREWIAPSNRGIKYLGALAVVN